MALLTTHVRNAAAGVLMALLASHACLAQVQELNEDKIKAGLLYNFLKYTDWPGGGDTLNVCLYHADSFGGSLDPLRGRTAQQYKIHVIRVSDGNIGSCSLLFIPASEAADIGAALSFAQGRKILTMSDSRGFARQGGMVELATKEDQRIHIIINEAAAEAAGLRIQPRMARLAEVLK